MPARKTGTFRVLFRGIAMDSARQIFSVDQIADLVDERLMEKNGSLANLGTASLEAIEDRTLESVALSSKTNRC